MRASATAGSSCFAGSSIRFSKSAKCSVSDKFGAEALGDVFRGGCTAFSLAPRWGASTVIPGNESRVSCGEDGAVFGGALETAFGGAAGGASGGLFTVGFFLGGGAFGCLTRSCSS